MSGLILIKNEESEVSLREPKQTLLHENYHQSLFDYKGKMLNYFGDIKGTFFIDHFSFYIIDRDGKIIPFSATPSVEYNLFSQGIWKYDNSFCSQFNQENRFYSWEKAYEESHFSQLKQVKEIKHNFQFGFNLSKQVNSYQLIYSFATRSQIDNLINYYSEYINELFAIGDYVYSHIHVAYLNTTGNDLIIDNNKNSHKRISPFLKLVT